MMSLFLFLSTLLAPAASFANPLFLDVSGHLDQTPEQIYAELTNRFTKPLDASRDSILFSYIKQAHGQGDFFFHLVIEPTNAGDVEAFEKYVRDAEANNFFGMKVHFQKVIGIQEMATLQMGHYAGDEEDPFHVDAGVDRNFSFSSLREWIDFSNEYGFALLAKDNAKFLDYIKKFLNDKAAYDEIRDTILATSNMVAINPKPFLVLEDNTVIGPDFETSPFLPFRFIRNCFSAEYENGMCYQNAQN
jgi:hypothetical protein